MNTTNAGAAAPPGLLITLTGRDRPGVTSRLFSLLAAHPLTVLDVEQVVIRGRLVLGVLVGLSPPGGAGRPGASGGRGRANGTAELAAVSGEVTALAGELGMEAEIATGTGNGPRRRGGLHVTVLGSPLMPRAIAAIAGRIAAGGANIDRIGRLAQDPVTCVEFDVSGADAAALRASLAAVASAERVDVAVQPGGLVRRAMRLIVMDVDSTLVQDEVVDLLAERAGCAAEVAEITEATMRGELDFAASLRERVALLAGLDVEVLDSVRSGLRLAPGARTLIGTLKRLGYRCGIVSGGFTQITDALAGLLGIDYAAANTLEIAGGKLTGKLTGTPIDRAGKARALAEFAGRAGVPLSQTVAVGDGANDLDMIAAAGLGVAFNAKPVVRDAADTSVSVPYLDAILYLLGISRDEVEAAGTGTGEARPGSGTGTAGPA